jgi:DNA-binding MarR family transcriptional regulator
LKAAKKTAGKGDWGQRLCDAGRDVGLATMVFHNAIAAKLGLNPIDHRCFDLLHSAGSATAGELATWTGLTTGAVTAMIDRLEQAGYVQRGSHPEDRRKVVIHPIPGRWEEVTRLFAPVGSMIEGLSKSYTQAELEVIVDYMKRSAELFRCETAKLAESAQK